MSGLNDYCLHRGNELDRVSQVIKLLEELALVDGRDQKLKGNNKPKKGKSKNNIKKNKNNKKEKKLQNPCKLKGHLNHKCEDCYNNPKSENFKGNTRSVKDEAKEEENNLIEHL